MLWLLKNVHKLFSQLHMYYVWLALSLSHLFTAIVISYKYKKWQSNKTNQMAKYNGKTLAALKIPCNSFCCAVHTYIV